MDSSVKPTLFISYAHSDSAFVDRLEADLHSRGFDTWVDRRGLEGGDDWRRELQAAVDRSQGLLVVLSPEAVASEYVEKEYGYAFDKHKFVIPLYYRPCDVPMALGNIQRIDFQGNYEQALAKLAQDLHGRVETLSHDSTHVDLEASEPGRLPTQEGVAAMWEPEGRHPQNYIPFSRNPLFQPRPGEFEHLESILLGPGVEEKATRPGLVGMVGLGGVGKTQLAIQLAYHYLQRFPAGIFWMPASGTSISEWQHQLALLAVNTEYLPEDDDVSNPENKVRRARYFCHYLANHADALLILDNVEDPNLVTTALPALAGEEVACSILYTSRIRLAPAGAKIYSVEELSEESALRLLLETTRPSLLTGALTNSQLAEATAARAVCQMVGCLPLPLMHLRSLLARDQHLTLVRLSEVLKQRGALEIEKKTQQGDAAPLFATFWLSWEKVRGEDAQRLFKLASYFPEAAPIPRWLLGIAAGLGEGQDIFEPLGEACIQLQELSLMEELSGDQVWLHRLVREFGRRLVAEDGEKGKTLLKEAGERLTSELGVLNRLEQRAVRESYMGCLERVHAARKYAELLLTSQAEQLVRVEQWLGRESSLFVDGRWWPQSIPGLFYQQLFNRSTEEGQPFIESKAPSQWLRQLRQVGAEDRLLLRVFLGHTSSISSVAFSPDGSKVLTGSADQTARLWETATGRMLVIFRGHAGPVTSVAFSPDGTKVLTGANDWTARLWEAATGRELMILRGHSDAVTSVAFSPDGSKVLTGSNDDTARLWETAGGQTLITLRNHSGFVSCVAFSPDGTKVLTGSPDFAAHLWEVASGRELITLRGHSDYVMSVAFSPDGKMILTGSGDDTARLWETASGQELAILQDQLGATICSATFSPDGSKVLTGAFDRTAHLWDAVSGHGLLILRGHTSSVNSVVFSPDGTMILTGSADRTARLWTWEAIGRETTSLQGHSRLIWSIAFSPDGAKVLTGSSDETARLWDTASGQELLTLHGHSDTIRSVAFSPDGSSVLTGADNRDRTARLWDAANGRELVTLRGHSGSVRSVAFSPDGSKVLTGSADRTARLWDATNGHELTTLCGHSGYVTSVAFSPDGTKMLSGSADQTARLWETASGCELMILDGHTDFVTGVTFSPDGTKMLTASADQTARLWDMDDGQELATLHIYSSLRRATFSPDGRFVITCDDRGQVHLFQVSGAEVGRLEGMYVATYEVGAIHWQNATHPLLADMGGPQCRPHFYHLKLEGIW